MALNIDRLDMTVPRRSLCKHASGLSLLPHPVQMEDASLIREDHLQRVIGLLRASYTHLILDLSKSFTPTDVTALRMADVILLVAQLELSSLRNVVRMLLTLGNDDGAGRQGEGRPQPRRLRDGDISLKKAEETIGKPIFWQIPNDSEADARRPQPGVPLHAARPARARCSRPSPAWRSAVRQGRPHGAAKEKTPRFWFRSQLQVIAATRSQTCGELHSATTRLTRAKRVAPCRACNAV